MTDNIFQPKVAIHPGRTLQDILESLPMSQVDLAERTGLTTKTINEIIQGKNPITPDTAIKLAAVFDISTNFWNNLQRQYDETLARIKLNVIVEKQVPLLNRFFCYNDLAKFGFIAKTSDPKERVLNLLNFFGVSSLELVESTQAVAFRKVKESKVSNESLAAWLRCGENIARNIPTQDFDREKMANSLGRLRSLTSKNTNFKHELIDICANFGVAVVFTPHFSKTFVNGATKWIAPNKAMIQLSLRGGRSDIFWFTFFHELGHLYKHGKKDQFVEFDKTDFTDVNENEADFFASQVLIQDKYFKPFLESKKWRNGSEIRRFADSVDISVGIVAGRLARELNDWKSFERFRTRIKFV